MPVSAVIDSGVRKVVLVQPGEGRFEPREVQLGARSEDWVEVKGGIAAGEIRRRGGQLPHRRGKQPAGRARGHGLRVEVTGRIEAR